MDLRPITRCMSILRLGKTHSRALDKPMRKAAEQAGIKVFRRHPLSALPGPRICISPECFNEVVADSRPDYRSLVSLDSTSLSSSSFSSAAG